MRKGRSRFAPAVSVVNEALEGRLLLSGIAPALRISRQSSAEVAARGLAKDTTKTLLAVSAGTLGQPITFTVTVRTSAAAGSPEGTVNIVDHGAVIQTLTLSPTTSTNPGMRSAKPPPP